MGGDVLRLGRTEYDEERRKGKMGLMGEVKVKVKFFHTRYRALGPELIPLYRQSAHWCLKVTAGLAESNGSLSPYKSAAG